MWLWILVVFCTFKGTEHRKKHHPWILRQKLISIKWIRSQIHLEFSMPYLKNSKTHTRTEDNHFFPFNVFFLQKNWLPILSISPLFVFILAKIIILFLPFSFRSISQLVGAVAATAGERCLLLLIFSLNPFFFLLHSFLADIFTLDLFSFSHCFIADFLNISYTHYSKLVFLWNFCSFIQFFCKISVVKYAFFQNAFPIQRTMSLLFWLRRRLYMFLVIIDAVLRF